MKRLLFVSPAVPSPTGSGVQMRAWTFLQALARRHAVTLVAGSPGFAARERDLDGVHGSIEEVVTLDFDPRRDPFLLARALGVRLGVDPRPSWDWAAPTPLMRRRLATLHARRFDRVHVFRLYMLPVVEAAAPNGAPSSLDLDDWESQTRHVLARLAQEHDRALAGRFEREASALTVCEHEWLPRFDRVYVASGNDASALGQRHPQARFAVVPNAVAVPPELPPSAPPSDPAELLFVGSLGYLPNRDAVERLLDGVLPKLGGTVRLTVAGAGAPPHLAYRVRAAGGRLLEAPARMEPLYARAQIALLPIRAGGGTRIKALEAFARGCPVLATAAAMAGLDVVPNLHYLPAESASEWIAAIRILLGDARLRDRLARAAFAWVKRHDRAQVIDAIDALTG